MNTRRIKNILFLCLAGITLYSCQLEPSDTYSIQLRKLRYTKDSLLKFDQNSPLEHGQKVRFVELAYFAPDTNYKVIADVEKINSQDTMIIEDTHKDLRKFHRILKLHFNIQGKPYSLFAYKQVTDTSNDLFIPFYDATNGKETHEGGRYIDIDYNGKDKIVLDFNFAYNPYCAYSQNYGCPIPPQENKLPVRIEAGEKEYKDN